MLRVTFPRAVALEIPEAGVIGRRWLAERGLEDREVSGRHCRLTRKAGVVFAEDLGSRNGTWVDGRLLDAGQSCALRDGSVLRVGRVLAVFRTARPSAPADDALGGFVGPFTVPDLRKQIELLRERAAATILVCGETGSGKELLSRAVAAALRPARAYVAVNVAGVAPGVFESQLFGHVAGAFSDGRVARRGVVAASDGGTVFLDEIGELPLALQPKLLRLVEHHEILPVGAERPIRADVLIVAATNRDLVSLSEAGGFRPDLLARLRLHTLALPPLRERREDFFAVLQTACAAVRLAPLEPGCIETEALERLVLGTWPDNVRGVQRVLGQVASVDAPGALRDWAVDRVLGHRCDLPPPSRVAIEAALAATGASERSVARRFGLSRGGLRRLLGKG